MYRSTRSNTYIHSSEAILKGLASDGGLFVFTTLNQTFVNQELLNLDYKGLSKLVLEELLTDYATQEINTIVEKSYHNNFPKQVVKIRDFDEVAYLELYHGNTFAFKDMALSMLPHLFETAKQKHNIEKRTVILTATSGDTGSAALDGFSQLDDTHVIVLYPTKGVSEFQEIQMNSYQSDQHTILAVDGNFDDCQRIVKEVFLQANYDNILLSSANSINIGRIIPQVIYYIYSYLELVRKDRIQYGNQINITVPTGNFGNIYAAYIAKKLGLPVHKLIIASNQNNVLTELFHTGLYNTNRPLYQSISPSMDILVSSNVERYLFDTFDEEKVSLWMKELRNNGEVQINGINKDNLFYAAYTSEEDTLKEMKKVFVHTNYLIDPHTAVASKVSSMYQNDTFDERYMLVVSTANPYKFSGAVIKGLALNEKAMLEDKFFMINNVTGNQIDPRMKTLLNKKTTKIEVSLEDAYQTVLKVIGDLND